MTARFVPITRILVTAALLCCAGSPAFAQAVIENPRTGVPTLAPLLGQVTPAVVNISVLWV